MKCVVLFDAEKILFYSILFYTIDLDIDILLIPIRYFRFNKFMHKPMRFLEYVQLISNNFIKKG